MWCMNTRWKIENQTFSHEIKDKRIGQFELEMKVICLKFYV